MWPLIIALSVIILTAMVHSYRGEGINYFERWTVSVCIAVGMYFFGLSLNIDDASHIINSVITGIGMYIYLCQPWSRWYTIGHAERDLGGIASAYEKIIECIGRSINDRKWSDMLCWTISAYIFTLPLIIVNGIWVILPPLMILTYALSWKLSPLQRVIRNAEMASGGLFAAIALLTAYVTYYPAAHLILKIFR